MPPPDLWFLTEGEDDQRFFDRIIKPHLEKNYSKIHILQCACLSKKKINELLVRIKTIGDDYLYCVDINRSPCKTQKKQTEIETFNELALNKIMVIVMEIESWYLAGIDRQRSQNLEIAFYSSTDDITKSKFRNMIPARFKEDVRDFKVEMLKHFQVEVAVQRNASFRYFCDKYL